MRSYLYFHGRSILEPLSQHEFGGPGVRGWILSLDTRDQDDRYPVESLDKDRRPRIAFHYWMICNGNIMQCAVRIASGDTIQRDRTQCEFPTRQLLPRRPLKQHAESGRASALGPAYRYDQSEKSRKNEFGVMLFDRIKRPIQLTSDGGPSWS